MNNGGKTNGRLTADTAEASSPGSGRPVDSAEMARNERGLIVPAGEPRDPHAVGLVHESDGPPDSCAVCGNSFWQKNGFNQWRGFRIKTASGEWVCSLVCEDETPFAQARRNG